MQFTVQLHESMSKVKVIYFVMSVNLAIKKKLPKIHQKPLNHASFLYSLMSCEHSNKAYMHCSTEKPLFILLTSVLPSACYELSHSTVALSTLFTLYDVLNAFLTMFCFF